MNSESTTPRAVCPLQPPKTEKEKDNFISSLILAAQNGFGGDVDHLLGLCRETWGEEQWWGAVKDLPHGPQKRTHLMYAAKKGDVPRQRWLLTQGATKESLARGAFGTSKEALALKARLEQQNSGQRTALYWAVRDGSLETLRDLHRLGADLESPKVGGITTLMVAAGDAHPDVVAYLLDNGLDINKKDEYNGSTALSHACRGFIKDVREGGVIKEKYVPDSPEMSANRAAVVRLLVHRGASIDEPNNDGLTPLMLACIHERLSAATVLLEMGANIERVDNKGLRALDHAASNNHPEVVALLVSRGANLDAATPILYALRNKNNTPEKRKQTIRILLESMTHKTIKTSFFTNTPLLILAAETDDLDIVNALLAAGAEVNERDAVGKTPLLFAARKENLGIIQALLAAGANVNAADTQGNTPLMKASEVGRIDAIQALLAAGAEVNAADIYGNTPLTRPLYNSRVDVIQVLLAAGAEVNLADSKGRTPLMTASDFANVDAIQVLLAAGAEVNAADSNGITPLMRASEAARIDVIQALLAAGANVNAADTQGHTPLMRAIFNGSVDAIQVLLAVGADVNAGDSDGITPLMRAIRDSKLVEAVEALLMRGAAVNAKTHNGTTPLMFASAMPNVDIVKMLLRAGAKVNAANSDGVTSLYVASAENNIENVKVLLQAGAVNTVVNNGDTPLSIAASPEIAALIQAAMATNPAPTPTEGGRRRIRTRRKRRIITRKRKYPGKIKKR